jgi:plastocyanin
VKVVNQGSSSHTWTSNGTFDSGNLDSGQSYTYTFHSAGAFNFYCQYHSSIGMKGRITVQ